MFLINFFHKFNLNTQLLKYINRNNICISQARHKQILVLDTNFLRIHDICLAILLRNASPMHVVSYPQISLIRLISYFNKLNLNSHHFTLTLISNPLFDTATWQPFCFFTSFILFIHVFVIYQKKAF